MDRSVTSRFTWTVALEFCGPDAEMEQVWFPAANCPGLTETLTLKGVLPLAGFTCTHGQSAGLDSVTDAPFEGFWLASKKLRAAGSTPPISNVKSRTAGAAVNTVRSVTSRFTWTVALEFCGPDAEIEHE
jgi:hypothetical protein